MTLKKLLRQSIIKSVSYIQIMLDILGNLEQSTLEDVKNRLLIEKDRYLKKNNDILKSTSRRNDRFGSSRASSRSNTPRD